MKQYLVLFVFLIINLPSAVAQEVEMGDVMRSEGKIYVVVAVAFIALAILSFYMIRIDRKVSKLEKELNK
ncbi:MAG: CcmD family protein [Bacteroidetes bacterium]|nr:CcmD family protein [Bacteroidota bacterium]